MKIGVWSYDSKQNTINHSNGYYWLDLDGSKDSAGVLDWIIQLSGKNWVSSRDLGDLVRIFDRLLHLQSNYCSWGENKKVKNTKDLISQNAIIDKEMDEFAKMNDERLKSILGKDFKLQKNKYFSS